MLRALLPVAVVAIAPLYAHAVDNLVLKSVSVDLPTDDRLFPSMPGVEAANSSCLACHSADMVLNQPAQGAMDG